MFKNTRMRWLRFNTICRIAAGQGNVPSWEIDQCSRQKSMQIENAASVRELLVIRERMLKDYCALVRNVRAPLYSPLVQQIVDRSRKHSATVPAICPPVSKKRREKVFLNFL